MTDQRLFLSHAKRDPRDRALAVELTQALRRHDIQVFLDEESIPPGDLWEERIRDEIEQACTGFVVLWTATAETSPWVQAEIRQAIARSCREPGFRIVPIFLVSQSKNEEYIELRKFQGINSVFRPNELAAILAVRFGRSGARIPPAFADLIVEWTQDFVGREYVFDRVDSFLRRHDRGYFTLVGEPGTGKTSVLAAVVEKRSAYCFFNIRAQGIDTATDFIGAMALQLSMPDLKSEPRPSQAVAQIFEELGTRAKSGGSIFLVVDALDEARTYAQDAGANALFLPQVLPPHVYVLVSHRKGFRPLAIRGPQEMLDFHQHDVCNRSDIQRFIDTWAAKPLIASWMDRSNVDPANFRDVMTRKSELNFMYLRYVLGDIANGRGAGLDFSDLPQGLRGYYEAHWRQMGLATSHDNRRKRLEIVFALAEARSPVSLPVLCRLLAGADPALIQEAIDDWLQFLRIGRIGGRVAYSIYHDSFRGFLQDSPAVQAAGLSMESVRNGLAECLRADPPFPIR